MLGLEMQRRLLFPRLQLLKRLFDLVFITIMGIPTIPLILLIMLLIKLDSPGPIFFVQKRPGYKGRPFSIYKFRTMYIDAERRLSEMSPHLRREFEMHGKIKDDPRVTRVGLWLRKFSLDELPQLWNVLWGEMSLVGPRAYLMSQLSQVGSYKNIISQALPGMTGIWQVSGRSELTFEERLEMDSYYVKNWSIWLDLYIIARTVWVVLSGKGAY
jgi:lipopolysaccharide/colanic/teichoic acid biosynthesis glycosyltransferase